MLRLITIANYELLIQRESRIEKLIDFPRVVPSFRDPLDIYSR